MRAKDFITSLIKTKLHRPPPPVTLVPRPHLIEWLEERRELPLTLVSAPAGYGKSTLISCWLETVDWPTAWISLDEHDNGLGDFLSYFLAAIQTIFPNAITETKALLMVTDLPPISVIAKIMINELNQIQKPFLLVLDDYQHIDNRSIHDLLNELLLHPSKSLHLVLGTRMDPPLSLVTLRAKSQVAEIRIQDLRFNFEETQLLFQKMIGVSIEPEEIIEIDDQSEGWITGLRLAALAMMHRLGRSPEQGSLSVQNRYVTEYLVNEILAKQAATISDCMLKTSILERFCPDLCEVICFRKAEPSGNGTDGLSPAMFDFNGVEFLEWLQSSNLFVISLDDRNVWFRYHHLFRDFLQQELARRFGPDEIANLHDIAGLWYAQNGWIEEAFYHLLPAGDISAAIELVAQHRYAMMNTTQWTRLERWLSQFPADVVETSEELWMVKTWLAYHRGQFSELPAYIKHLDAMMVQKQDRQTVNRLAGEISSLRSLVAYHNGDAEGAILFARDALDLIDPELWIVRVMARMYLGGSLLLTGDENGSYHAMYDAFEEEKVQDTRFTATLLMTACNIHWVTADLQSMTQAAKQCIALSKEPDSGEILGYGYYHLGRVRYQQNDLVAAEELFASVVAKPYQNYGISYSNSACGLGMTYQALGRETEARQVVEDAIAFLLETGNTSQLPIVLASQAEVALRQGRRSDAKQWAKKLDPIPPMAPMALFLAPHMTLVKVWLAEHTFAGRGKAADLLSQLQEYLEGIHNTRFLIDTLALLALLNDESGDQSAAMRALEKALRLAQPGRFVRVFVDLGAQMAHLLRQLRVDQEMDDYIGQILSSFPESQETAVSVEQGELLEALTNREFQVLELLGGRLTNKEIAAQLVISLGTVKGHVIHIYHKMDVKNRREAVEKAVALGMLNPNILAPK